MSATIVRRKFPYWSLTSTSSHLSHCDVLSVQVHGAVSVGFVLVPKHKKKQTQKPIGEHTSTQDENHIGHDNNRIVEIACLLSSSCRLFRRLSRHLWQKVTYNREDYKYCRSAGCLTQQKRLIFGCEKLTVPPTLTFFRTSHPTGSTAKGQSWCRLHWMSHYALTLPSTRASLNWSVRQNAGTCHSFIVQIRVPWAGALTPHCPTILCPACGARGTECGIGQQQILVGLPLRTRPRCREGKQY